MKDRIAFIDNIKALLIFLVVFGHIIEKSGNIDGKNTIYTFIYAFHMPLFIFVSGLFHKSSPKRISRFLVLYFVYQTVYCIYDSYVSGELKIQYTTPIWTVWYLLSTIFWYIAAVLIDLDGRKGLRAIGIAFAVALLAGFEKTVKYYLSLSRTIALMPFFLCGVYVRKNFFDTFVYGRKKLRTILPAVLPMTILCIVMLIPASVGLSRHWLYYALPYGSSGGTVFTRAFFMLCAVAFSIPIILCMPDKHIPVMTNIGKNTFSIYILHGIIINFMKDNKLLGILVGGKPLYALILAAITVLALSGDTVARIASFNRKLTTKP